MAHRGRGRRCGQPGRARDRWRGWTEPRASGGGCGRRPGRLRSRLSSPGGRRPLRSEARMRRGLWWCVSWRQDHRERRRRSPGPRCRCGLKRLQRRRRSGGDRPRGTDPLRRSGAPGPRGLPGTAGPGRLAPRRALLGHELHLARADRPFGRLTELAQQSRQAARPPRLLWRYVESSTKDVRRGSTLRPQPRKATLLGWVVWCAGRAPGCTSGTGCARGSRQPS
jgi:hypothetical protein